MYRGTILRTYNRGQIIDVTVQVDATHGGYFEFRVCNVDGLFEADNQCLASNLLANQQGYTRFLFNYGYNSFKLVLPSTLSCNHCVLQVILVIDNILRK